MSKLESLLQELCPDGVEHKPLKDIAIKMFRGSGIKRTDLTETGIPCVRYGEIYTTYGVWFDTCVSHTVLENNPSPKYFENGDILFAITGEKIEEIAKCTAYVGHEQCMAGGDLVVMKHNQNAKYLSYVLSTTDAQQQKSKGKVKSKVVHASLADIQNIVIPVPPLPVQEEIVRILDQFTQTEMELQNKISAEIEARKKQHDYYKKKLLSFGKNVEWKTLGDVGKVSMCKRIMKAETSTTGDIPFYKIGTFGKEPDAFISKETFEKYKAKYSYPKKGDILISAAGTIGRTVVFDGEPAYFQDSNIVWIANDENMVLNQFLYYYYQLQPWKASEGGTISRLYNDNISKAKIPVPTIEEQKWIIGKLNQVEPVFDTLVSELTAELSARQTQYEYYRDKLLTFKARA